jgi:hypothetical protein
MIVTDRFLFLHLHKSGGTFVNALLMRCVRSALRVGYHLPYRELPSIYRNLPVVGTVRSPWAYYVSWYHFQRDQENPNILFRICSNHGELGFKETITNLVLLSGDEIRLVQFEAGVPDTFVNHGLNLTKKCVGELRERRLGFYSFLHERLYDGAENPTILRVEHLRDELRTMLSERGLLNECAEQFLDEAQPLNVSKHDEPARYYDDELTGLVAERDRAVIDRYGYTLGAIRD